MCIAIPNSLKTRSDARLILAYRATRYTAGGAVARIGARSDAVDALLRTWRVHEAAFLGAWNPYSRKMPAGWNAMQHRRLLTWLRRMPHQEGQGRGPAWAETHVLAALPARRAVVLARRFRQAAIVLVASARPARLRLLPPRFACSPPSGQAP